MRVVIFGTGKKYQRLRDKIKKDLEIVVFLDNDSSKWGHKLDGVEIVSPQEIYNYEYDFIIVLSVYQTEMITQLKSIGVSGKKIFDMHHIEKICQCEPAQYYGKLSIDNTKKKILIYSHALTSTGAQNVLYIAIKVLKKKNYDLVVVSKIDGALRYHIQELDIPVILMRDSYFEEKEFKRLIHWADKIIVNTLLLYYVIEDLVNCNKPVIWWIHETGLLQELDKDKFIHIFESKNIFMYAVSPLVKRKIIQKTSKDIIVGELKYGLPFYRSILKNAFQQEKIIFAIIGAIDKIKGQDIFLRAVESLSDDYQKKAEFLIVGRGELWTEELKQLGNFPSVKLIGEIENQKMPELYNQIDVVVCCSRLEAMSVVITEGCMTKRLVIVSDVAGIADFITNRKNGLIFKSENIEELAELMKWTIDHREQARQMGSAAKEIYEKYFSMEIFEKNLLSAIEEK